MNVTLFNSKVNRFIRESKHGFSYHLDNFFCTSASHHRSSNFNSIRSIIFISMPAFFISWPARFMLLNSIRMGKSQQSYHPKGKWCP